MWGVESEGVGSTVPTKIDTKSLTLPHELYASVSRRLSRRGRRLRAPRVAVAPRWRSAGGTRVRRGHWRRGPHAGGTATGPTGGVALVAIGAAAIPTYALYRPRYTRRRIVTTIPAGLS